MDNGAEGEDDVQMETAIRVFAHFLGVDLNTEEDLLPAVRAGFYDLPEGWEVGIGDGEQNAGIPYFYNATTEESAWQHPREEQCRRRLEVARMRKRERMERGPPSRGRGRMRQSDDPRNADRRGDSRSQQGRRDNSSERSSPRMQEAAAVEEFGGIEDLEESAKFSPVQQRGQSAAATQGRPGAGGGAGANTGGMFMKQDDFFERDEGTVGGRPQHGREGRAGAGGSNQRPDHSMSPPLFKEMRDQGYDQPSTPGSGGEGPRRAVQGANAGGQGNAVRGAGWVQAGAASESVLGSSQVDQDRRDYTRAGDRDRDVSNQRGRALRDDDDRRSDSAGRGGGGRGWHQGGDPSRERDRDRDLSRNGREGRERDWREDPRDRMGGGGRDGTGGRYLGNRDADARERRDPRDDRDRDTDRDKFRDRERDRAYSAPEDEVGPSTQRSRSSGQSERFPRGGSGAAAPSLGDAVPHVTEKERELRAEVERYKEDVRKLTEDCTEQVEKLATVRTKHAGEVATLKDEAARLELRLVEERRERKQLEEQVTQAHAEHHAKVRELEDVHEIRLREAVRKARTEAEEESREKMRQVERRYIDEADALRAEMALLKRKLEETQREADNSKRKITLSKQDGKLEAQTEIDALKGSIRDMEEAERRQALEARRVREELAAVQGRLAAALQAVQVAHAESDALRAAATTAVHDEQAHNGALQAAMQRIQILDTENAQQKAELVLLRREKEALTLETRKLRGTAEFSGDRLATTETEGRRIRAQAQAEVSRLTSRATELEALVSVLRGQLDQASSHEAQAVREVARQLDSAEAEASRLKDRLADREVKEEALTSRIKSHEKELVRLQELVFKRERQVREEQEKAESIQAQIEAIRKSYEGEVEEAKAALNRQRQASADLAVQHRKEIERLEAEIAEKVPEMIGAAVAQVEARCATRHSKELAEQRLAGELQLDKLKRELTDLQATYSDKEARQRLQLADERVELEKLRQGYKGLQRRNEDLEEQVLELRRQLRVVGNSSHYLGGTPAGVQRGGGSRMVDRSMGNWSVGGGGGQARDAAAFQSMLEQSFDGVRQSREGYYAHGPAHRGFGDPSGHQYQHDNDENYRYDGNQVVPSEEEVVMSHTVSFINDQLAFMKKQISSSLQPRDPPARQHPVMERAALDRSAIDSSRPPAGTGGLDSSAALSGLHSQSQGAAAHHHVKFSPEALFHSPQSKSHRRNRAGDDASLKEALRAVHLQEEQGQGQGQGKVVPEQSAQLDLEPQEEVEVLDEPRRPSSQPQQHRAPTLSTGTGGRAHRAEAGVDVTTSAAFDDYSLSNVSYSYLHDTPALSASYSATPSSATGHNRYAHLEAGLSRSSFLGGVGDFSAISDGGYHEGYWRAKYMRPASKQ